MAFTSAIIPTGANKANIGSLKCITGTYTNSGGGTGGDITTGMKVIIWFGCQPKGSAVIATQTVVNETFPLSGTTAVTIVTSADEVGNWIAIGY